MTRGLLLFALAACAATPRADEPYVEPPYDSADPCADYTWATAGAPLVLTWCTPCHSADLDPSRRQGAPAGVDLDDADDVLAQADRVLARATGEAPTMPPASGPTPEERALLADWIACATR